MSFSDIYASQKTGRGLGILSLHGRVLFCLIEDPNITRLALSLILNVSESAIDKSISILESENLLHVSRNGRKSRYVIDSQNLYDHPDFRAIILIKEQLNDQERINDA